MNRRLPLFAAVAGLTLSTALIAPTGASASPSPDAGEFEEALQAAAKPLTTPFEDSDGATWTTFDEWLDFWSALDDSSDRVEVDQYATSGEGRPIHAITVGYPAPPSTRAQARGSVLLLNCSIHGNEPAGREACMILARDMSTTQDPRVLRFLSQTTVVMTNVNPDGWVHNVRGNAERIDVNRDFMTLETNEGQALISLVNQRRPDVMNDLHEYGPSRGHDWQATTLWPRNRNVDPGVQSMSRTMVREYVAPAITSRGLTHGTYGERVKDGEPYLRFVGDDQARILRNYTGLRHIVGQLTESATRPTVAAEQDNPALLNRNRVAVQYASVIGNAEIIEAQRDRIAQTTAAAAERATRMGAAQEGVIYFAGQDDMLPTQANQVEPDPMCGYTISTEDAQKWARTLELHGITHKPSGDEVWVPMGQPARGLIPLLFDERSEHAITEGTPHDECR